MLNKVINLKFKKYQKQQRRFRGIDVDYCFPKNAIFGLKSLETKRVFDFHLEAVRKTLQKKMKKNLKENFKICVFPDLPLTKKSSGIRMGKGKGEIGSWCFPIHKGRVLFEMNILNSFQIANKYFQFSKKKLPFKVKLLKKKRFMI